MTNICIILDELKASLSEKRFFHSVCVAKRAVELSEIYGANKEKAQLAGLVHDCCKELSKEEQRSLIGKFRIRLSETEKDEPNIWHGYAASGYIQNKWSITDKEIVNAVKYHTCGRKNMLLLEKIIFIADLTSEDRKFPEIEEIRKASEKSLDMAIYNCYQYVLPKIISRKDKITQNTVDCYNDAVRIINDK